MLRYYRKSLPQIVFSDESGFCDGPNNSSHWRLKDYFSDRTTAAYSKHSESWIFWGAIGLNNKSHLYFYDGSVDKVSYIKCLKDVNLFSSLDEKYGKYCNIFQQDGASCRTAKETMEYLNDKARILRGCPQTVLTCLRSRCVGPIRNISNQDYREQKQKKSLMDKLFCLWEEIPLKTINKLVLSFENRLKMVKQVGGKSISHFLSAGKKAIPDEYFEHYPSIISPDDIETIFKLYQKYGRKWIMIA